MQYDFTSLTDRTGTGAIKWNIMKNERPDVPAGIVPFSVADMELAMPPAIIKGLQQWLSRSILGYTEATQSYYDAVTGYMKRWHQWDVRQEDICVSPGVVPALHNLVCALTQPGEGVIIQPPVYPPFFHAIQRGNRRVVENTLLLEDGRYRMDYEDLKQKASDPSVTMMILCSPHNPVGRVWTSEELRRVFEICRENHVLLVSDEIHFDIIMPGHRHQVVATLCQEAAEQVIVCTAPSKTFNIAGLQVSNIVIPRKEWREKFQYEQSKTAFESLNAPGYEACRIAYTACDDWLKAFLKHIDGNRRLVQSYLETRLPQIQVIPLEGTYLQWLDCRALKLSPEEQKKMMLEANLFLDEGTMFGKPGEGFERVNLACPSSVLEQALERLREQATCTTKQMATV